jgi:hypothetical protein
VIVRRLLAGGAALVAVGGAYRTFLRRPILTWGATAAEADGRLPGDALLESADGNWVWAFILEERDGKTRLISRNRFRLPTLKDRLGMIPMEPGSLVMERKMLLGMKRRAEQLAAV